MRDAEPTLHATKCREATRARRHAPSHALPWRSRDCQRCGCSGANPARTGAAPSSPQPLVA